MTYFLRGEARLLQSFRNGERQTLEGVYRAYVDMVSRVVVSALRRYCPEERYRPRPQMINELPDLVQEVFLRAFEPKTRLRFDGVRPYAPYLQQITRNAVVDHLRRKRRQLLVESDALVDEVMSHPVARHGADELGDRETLGLVDRYVANLPSDLKLVHDALYVRGLSQRDAAALLGVGRQVVRTLESRLREGLRGTLSGRANGVDAVALPRRVPRRIATFDREGFDGARAGVCCVRRTQEPCSNRSSFILKS